MCIVYPSYALTGVYVPCAYYYWNDYFSLFEYCCLNISCCFWDRYFYSLYKLPCTLHDVWTKEQHINKRIQAVSRKRNSKKVMQMTCFDVTLSSESHVTVIASLTSLVLFGVKIASSFFLHKPICFSLQWC